jgi:VWFA-related protein
MTHRLPILVMACAAAVWTAALPAQEPAPRTVYVSVLDRQGAPVPGLSATDFSVTEDGRARQISSAEPATAPLTLGVVIDGNGGGLAFETGLGKFVQSFPHDTRVGVFTTARSRSAPVVFTTDRRALVSGIAGLSPLVPTGRATPGSSLSSVAATVAAHLVTEAPQRAVMLLVVNEPPRGGRKDPTRCAQLSIATQDSCTAQETTAAMSEWSSWGELGGDVDKGRITLHVIHEGHEKGDHAGSMDSIADGSGGLMVLPAVRDAIDATFAKITAQILGQYAVTYTSAAAPKNGFRLQVRTSRAGLRLRAPTRTYLNP